MISYIVIHNKNLLEFSLPQKYHDNSTISLKILSLEIKAKVFFLISKFDRNKISCRQKCHGMSQKSSTAKLVWLRHPVKKIMKIIFVCLIKEVQNKYW